MKTNLIQTYKNKKYLLRQITKTKILSICLLCSNFFTQIFSVSNLIKLTLCLKLL